MDNRNKSILILDPACPKRAERFRETLEGSGYSATVIYSGASYPYTGSIPGMIQSSFELVKAVLDRRPDIIITSNPVIATGAIKNRPFLGFKVIYEPVPPARKLGAYAKLVEKIAFLFSNRIIVPDTVFLRHLRFKGIKAGKIEVIGHYPPLFREFTKEGIFNTLGFSRKQHLVILSRLEKMQYRDAALFIDTAHLLRHNPQLKFVFLTHTPPPDKLRKKVKDMEISNLHFLKLGNVEELNYVKDAAVSVSIPGKSCACSIPLAGELYENMMCAVPTITWKRGPVADLVQKHDSGAVLQSRDSVELAKVILTAVYDHARYPQLKKNCSETAGVCNWEKESAMLLKLL